MRAEEQRTRVSLSLSLSLILSLLLCPSVPLSLSPPLSVSLSLALSRARCEIETHVQGRIVGAALFSTLHRYLAQEETSPPPTLSRPMRMVLRRSDGGGICLRARYHCTLCQPGPCYDHIDTSY